MFKKLSRITLATSAVLWPVWTAEALEISSRQSNYATAASNETLEIIEPDLIYIRDPEKRMLRYFIQRTDFSSPEAEMIAANLARAGQDWTDICMECGIHFVEVSDRTEADFRVVAAPGMSPVMAKAFYPSAPAKDWQLMIAKSYFNEQSRYNKIGALRHELGHILGYRHEQAAADPARQKACGWSTEPAQVRLTGYDPKSIMHYPCSPVKETTTFGFSACDIAAHRRIYAPSSIAGSNDLAWLNCDLAAQ